MNLHLQCYGSGGKDGDHGRSSATLASPGQRPAGLADGADGRLVAPIVRATPAAGEGRKVPHLGCCRALARAGEWAVTKATSLGNTSSACAGLYDRHLVT